MDNSYVTVSILRFTILHFLHLSNVHNFLNSQGSLFYGIVFLGILILRNAFLQVAKTDETKVKINKWLPKNLSFNEKRIPSHYP